MLRVPPQDFPVDLCTISDAQQCVISNVQGCPDQWP